MGSAVSNRHLELFGGIIYNYGLVELGFKFCTAAVMQCHPHNVLIVSARQPAQVLAENLKALARDNLKSDVQSRLIPLIDRWTRYNNLRTSIAHHRWRSGIREGSIRPTYYEVRSGKSAVLGFKDDEKDYLIDDFVAAWDALAKLKDDLDDFMKKSGLEAIIMEKMDAQSAEDEASDGKA